MEKRARLSIERELKTGPKKSTKRTKDQADLSGWEIFITGSIEKPFISHSNCFGDNERASVEFLGQTKCPSATLLVNRRKPSPSQIKPLILLDRCPQKRKRVL